MTLTAAQRAAARDALATLEQLLMLILKDGSNWAASASLRSLKQLKKTLRPLVGRVAEEPPNPSTPA